MQPLNPGFPLEYMHVLLFRAVVGEATFSFLVTQSLISLYYLDSYFTLKPVEHPFFVLPGFEL